MRVDFHGLYQRHAQDVFRFAVYLSGCQSLADEITQQTFAQAWLSNGEIREGTVRAYLIAIARNLYRAELRRRKRTSAIHEAIPDPKPAADSALESREELARVFEALQSFPEADRAALLMHVQEGLPYETIAATLGVSVAAVKVKVHRTRAKLRLLLGNAGEQK